MSVHVHTNGDVAASEAKSSDHQPPPIPADALKDGKTNRQRLEASANALRSRLARTLESLDRRRHDALNIKVQAARHPLPIALLGAGAAAVVGGTALTIYHVATRQPPQNEIVQRLKAVIKAIQHPHRAAHSDAPSLTKEIVRGVVVSVASFAISQIAEKALVKFFPALDKKEEPTK